MRSIIRTTAIGFVLTCFLLHTSPVGAVSGGIIRDSEIESSLHDWTRDVIGAAGMSPEQVNIVLVENSDINAFVAGGANIFIYTGLIAKTDKPDEVVGVVAHELGHISGGHLTRTAKVARNASFEAMIGALIGIGAAIATGDSGAAAAGVAIGRGQAINGFLAHSRVQESSADQAGYRFMTGAGLNPSGLVSFLEKLSSQELLPSSQQSLYARTHPMSRDRVDALEAKLEANQSAGKAVPVEWQEQYVRMRAKLTGFVNPQQVMYAYPSNNQSIAAKYARAIAAYRMNHEKEALSGIEALLQSEPKNPYFWELKGQVLYEFGHIAESVPPYERAVVLAPSSGLIRAALAQSLIESTGANVATLSKAIDHLKRAENDEPRLTRIKRLLATAYGKMGQEQKARVYLAEEALMQGRRDEATRMASAVVKQLPKGSPEAIRAQDIINAVGDQGK